MFQEARNRLKNNKRKIRRKKEKLRKLEEDLEGKEGEDGETGKKEDWESASQLSEGKCISASCDTEHTGANDTKNNNNSMLGQASQTCPDSIVRSIVM